MISQSLGWTLIHSLWEGLAIYLSLKIAIRFTNRSDVRYGLGVAAMALIVISSAITFLMLNQKTGGGSFQVFLLATDQTSAVSQTSSVLDFINQNIVWFVRFWVLGFTIGLLRIAAGLWYINRLRRNANPVQDEWMNVVNTLSQSLNVKRVITMAEANISSPMVVGFMKPIILFPVGLLSGLTVDQVETILVHELAHIRRQDYIINLLQSVIETILFFNPFVLLISSLIREERENCCDDMVIAKGVSPISYVRTLAQLEVARSSSSLALGIAGSQNQLLNRIKRIMENSAKNDWGKGRFIPVALLFLGFICASWLSIGSDSEAQITPQDKKVSHNALASDTSKDDGLKVIKRGNGYNSWFVVPEEPGDKLPPLEFDEDEPADMSFGYSYQIDDLLPVESLEPLMMFHLDSIPGYSYSFRFQDPAGREQFQKEFTMKFKENFKEFYEKNQEQFDKMVEEMWRSENGKMKAAGAWRTDPADVEFANMARAAAEQARAMQRMSEGQFQESIDSRLRDMEAMAQEERALEMERSQSYMMQDQLQEQEKVLMDMAARSDAFQSELEKMLRDDGYIGKKDNLKQFNLNDNNGKMTINGHEIKEKDQVKYRALSDKYFSNKWKIQRHGRSE